MAEKTLRFISAKMANIDICMLTTKSSRGSLTSRPMSNNGDVKYDGNSFFFSYEDSQKIKDIKEDASVNMSLTTSENMYINVAGKARLIRTRAIMEQHWVPSLNEWFKDGLHTEGIVLIVVKANKIRYWNKKDSGEIKV